MLSLLQVSSNSIQVYIGEYPVCIRSFALIRFYTMLNRVPGAIHYVLSDALVSYSKEYIY